MLATHAMTRTDWTCKLLAVDLDGTLLNRVHEVSPPDRAALHRAHEAGLKVVLCTGRALAETRPVLDRLGLDLDAVVTVGGAVVTDLATGRTLARREMPPELARDVARWFQSRGYALLWLTDADAVGHDGFVLDGPRRHAQLDRWLSMTPCRVRAVPRLPADVPGAVRLTVVDEPEVLAELTRRLEDDFAGKVAHNILTAPVYRLSLIEMFVAGVSKWAAIQLLCERWGIDPGATAAVGDDVNDIDMIRNAGLGVAMENALPAVRAVARRTTRSHNEAGVAEVVGWLLDGTAASGT